MVYLTIIWTIIYSYYISLDKIRQEYGGCAWTDLEIEFSSYKTAYVVKVARLTAALGHFDQLVAGGRSFATTTNTGQVETSAGDGGYVGRVRLI